MSVGYLDPQTWASGAFVDSLTWGEPTVSTGLSQTPAGSSKRRRRFIMPDGTHLFATQEEAFELLERFSVPKPEPKKKKGKNKPVVVKMDPIEVFRPAKDAMVETMVVELPKLMVFKPDPAQYELALRKLKRLIDDEEALLALLL